MNICGNKRVCFELSDCCMYVELRTCNMTGGDEPCCILVSRFCSLQFSVVGDCKTGLEILCFVVVSMGNGNFGNSVIFGVVRSCRHVLKVLVLCGGMKMANYSS
jgi:hypothetical protein